MNKETSALNRERVVHVLNGWTMLPLNVLLLLGGIALLIYSLAAGARDTTFRDAAGLLADFDLAAPVGFDRAAAFDFAGGFALTADFDLAMGFDRRAMTHAPLL